MVCHTLCNIRRLFSGVVSCFVLVTHKQQRSRSPALHYFLEITYPKSIFATSEPVHIPPFSATLIMENSCPFLSLQKSNTVFICIIRTTRSALRNCKYHGTNSSLVTSEMGFNDMPSPLVVTRILSRSRGSMSNHPRDQYPPLGNLILSRACFGNAVASGFFTQPNRTDQNKYGLSVCLMYSMRHHRTVICKGMGVQTDNNLIAIPFIPRLYIVHNQCIDQVHSCGCYHTASFASEVLFWAL